MAFAGKLGGLMRQSLLKNTLSSNGHVPATPMFNSIRSMSSMDGQELHGRNLPVSVAKERSSGSSFGGGGESEGSGGRFLGLPPYTQKIGLPLKRVLYTVLRSPHIDKKSREQFEMRIKKMFLVIKTETRDLRKKFFWLKRQRIFGAQYEVIISCKTRLDKDKLQRLLASQQ